MHKMYLKISVILSVLIISFDLNIFAEEGITDSEIHIGLCGPLTGPAAVWGSVIAGGVLAFDIINSEGGINGRKIICHVLDDGYNPSKTKYLVKEISEKIGLFIWGACVGTEPSIAVKDYLIKRNIPWVSPLSGAADFIYPPEKNVFGLFPILSFEASLLCKFAIENLGKKRIGIVFQNDRYGKSALEGASKELLKNDMKLIYQVSVEPGDAKMKDIAQELKNLDADTVLIFTTPFSGLRLLKSSSDINFSPQWMGGITFSDFTMMYKMGNGLWKGMITTQQADLDSPLLVKYKNALKRFLPEYSEWTIMIHGGVGWAEPIIEALKRCGQDLTRKRFVQEMEGLNNFKGIGPPISFKPFDQNDPNCRRGIRDLYLVQCLEDGKIKKISDWIKIE